MHNLADRFQCSGIILGDRLLSEGRSSVDPKEINFDTEIDRGEMIVSADPGSGTNSYKRYKITQSGISPRAIPAVPGHTHTAATIPTNAMLWFSITGSSLCGSVSLVFSDTGNSRVDRTGHSSSLPNFLRPRYSRMKCRNQSFVAVSNDPTV